jgi:HPt (histidine-containing phosphotransfer) domain-containing protein
MASRHTQKPLRRGRRLAFLEPFTAGRDLLEGIRDDTQTGAAGQAEFVQDGGSGMANRAPSGLSGKLASELFARLLLELPDHRRDLQSAYRDGNGEQMERTAHKLLGAVVYCDLPELAAALRELKQTNASRDAGQAGPAYGKAIRLIDELLACSGYRGT